MGTQQIDQPGNSMLHLQDTCELLFIPNKASAWLNVQFRIIDDQLLMPHRIQPSVFAVLLTGSLITGSLMSHSSLADDTNTPIIAKKQCQTSFRPVDGNHDFLESGVTPMLSQTRINRIHITRLPIFNEQDPDENNAIYRFANRIHTLTQSENISQQLLFKSGDIYDKRSIDESARLLRGLDHLYDADIRVLPLCDSDGDGDGEVDLEVISKDVWSLNLDLSFGRSGGENKHRFGITESNLFGLGKEVSLITKKNDDRTTTQFSYNDNNLFGSRMFARFGYADSDDGASQNFSLGLPFFSLDSRRAWSLQLEQGERIDTQYFRGDDLTEIRRDIKDYGAFYGFSAGYGDSKNDAENTPIIKRWRFGYRYFKETFSVTDELPPPSISPRDQTLSYGYVQFEAIEDNYTKSFNFDQIHRTEDLHLGFTFKTSLGYAPKALGSKQTKLIYNGEFSDTLSYNKRVLLQHRVDLRGLWNKDTGTSEDLSLEYSIKYFRSQTEKRSFFAKLDALWTRNLNSNRQVVLGGSTGVRGFDKRLQTGDRRWVLTLEERQYTNYHLLNLAWLGFAAFIDVGRVYDRDELDSGLDENLLANVGLGLRLASSKADAGRIIHIDLAFPITNRDDPAVDSYQVVISIKNSL